MASLFPPPCPTLPDFRTLLVQGSVHPSAAIHFCLSYILHHDIEKAVLLAPSRTQFTVAIKENRDAWITEHGGDGRTCKAASRIDVLYPPSPTHVMFLLSMFHEALEVKGDFLHPKTTFATAPSLIVLCDLSSLFLEDPDATVSSYLNLISHALSAVTSLASQGGKPTAFAVFDSGLSDLRLPLLKPIASNTASDPSQATQPSPVRRESVAYLVQRFFEWTATIEEAPISPAAGQEMSLTTVRTCSCRIRRTFQGSEDEQEEIIWNWSEEFIPSRGTVYSWS